jgi:hypothetical protein
MIITFTVQERSEIGRDSLNRPIYEYILVNRNHPIEKLSIKEIYNIINEKEDILEILTITRSYKKAKCSICKKEGMIDNKSICDSCRNLYIVRQAKQLKALKDELIKRQTYEQNRTQKDREEKNKRKVSKVVNKSQE